MGGEKWEAEQGEMGHTGKGADSEIERKTEKQRRAREGTEEGSVT